jgi:hypothetical protein
MARYGVSIRTIGRSLCRRLYRHFGSRLASNYLSIVFNHRINKVDKITVVDMAESSIEALLDHTIGLVLVLHFQPRRHCGGRGWSTHGDMCSGVDFVERRKNGGIPQ